jgi:hypothetical protein
MRRPSSHKRSAARSTRPPPAPDAGASGDERPVEAPDGEAPPSTGTIDPGPSTRPERRLESILRALPPTELASIIERLGIRIDPGKRIDVPAQVARALVRVPDVREPSRMPPASAELVRRVAEANGSLVVASLPAGVEWVVRRGLLFARVVGPMVELMLPTAFLVQLKAWEGEDPRSLRALVSEAPFETAAALASHYLGRPATPPLALSLEAAWEVLGDPEALAGEIARISHQERRLLEQIEQVGGEVDSQELMDLEREPMRLRGAYGVAAGRRGAAFSLEKRGLLFPLHPNRYVIPTEVAAVIGEERARQRSERRERIRSHVMEEDHLPRRARFSADPGPLVVALAMAVSEARGEIRQGVGTPRSLIARVAQRFGQTFETTALCAALSRAIGLWEAHVSPATRPGALALHELAAVLFDTWRRGGAWDEARAEAETLRLAPDQRDPSPAGLLREMVLDALQDLGEEQWVPYQALVDYLREDPRTDGLGRLMRRWADRVGVPAPPEEEVARRILLGSLPALGVVDLGGAAVEAVRHRRDSAPGWSRSAPGARGNGGGRVDSPPSLPVEDLGSLAVRLTARGRRLIAGDRSAAPSESELGAPRRLHVGGAARVADLLELAAFTDVAAVAPALELDVAAGALSRGLAAGIAAAEMRGRLERVAPISEELARAFEQAGTVVGRGTLAPAGGFLWVEDPEVLAMLRAGVPPELFVDPSPPSGLLVAPGADVDRLVRHCRALGVEIRVEEGGAVVRHSTMPPPKRSDTNRRISWRPPETAAFRRRS